MSEWLIFAAVTLAVAGLGWYLWQRSGPPQERRSVLHAVHAGVTKVAAKLTQTISPAPRAPQHRGADELPEAAERAKLMAEIEAMGFRAHDVAAIVTGGRTRRQIGDDMIAACRKLPKGGSE